MESEMDKYTDTVVEDGELQDSDEIYVPLARPEGTSAPTPAKIKDLPGDHVSDSPDSTETSSDSEGCYMPRQGKQIRRKKSLKGFRGRPVESNTQKMSKGKKYDIWSAGLQEDTLMEDMRGIEVVKDKRNDRNVENYDYTLKHRLQDDQTLKRSFDSDDDSNDSNKCSKRPKYSCRSSIDKLSEFCTKHSTSTSSGDDLGSARFIHDLTADYQSEVSELAKELAEKLNEEKSDLIARIINILGKERPIELFKKVQKIERNGGMKIINGTRRRTSGGIFLFLLKNSDNISKKEIKQIFLEENKRITQERKETQSAKLNKRVEELKKRLGLNGNELVPSSKRTDLDSMLNLKPEKSNTLSNPPPSPVTNSGIDASPEYKSHAINHVHDTSPEKMTHRGPHEFEDESLTAYDDDILDMTCDDMDMF